MNIGDAIDAMKDGRWARRPGWNGEGMHVYLEEHQSISMPRYDPKKDKVVYSDIGRRHEPFFVLYLGGGRHQPGWNASTEDLLANDWEVVPYEEMK